MDALVARTSLAVRSSSALDRVEALYLKVLRASLLAAATILLLIALGWAAISVTRVLRSPDSVKEAPTTVAASELTGSQKPTEVNSGRTPPGDTFRNERAYYDDFMKRFYALYRTRYQPHLRADDKRLNASELDDLTVNTAARLAAIRNGDLDFATDRQDLETFLPIITEASSSKVTADRLARYKAARKRPVSTSVQRTRTETRRGWDSFSTSCVAWYESPIGCAVTRRVQIPFTQRVTVMRYPDGISSPPEVLKSYQDQYFRLLASRRQENAREARLEREKIIDGQAVGWAGLSRSLLIAGGFLVLMFFFLLVAIERHQRRFASVLVNS